MLPFLCFRCFHVSNSAEGLRCPRCDGYQSAPVMAANFDSAIPEYGNASPGYYTVEDATTQVSEEDLPPVDPTREASTQVSEEDLPPVEPTRESSTQVSEEDLPPVERTREARTETRDNDIPLQIAGSHSYENCLNSADPSQNQASNDFDHYTNANLNGLTHSNTNEGEFQNQSYDICNAATSQEVMDDKPIASQQTNFYEPSTVGECENKHYSDELLREQGTKEPTESRIKSDRFVFTDSITLESEAENSLSDSSEKVEDRQDNIPPRFSFVPRGNPSMNNCFQENSVTATSLAQQTPQSSNKFSKGKCKNCGKFFLKEWTFLTHLQNYCKPNIRYKCEECGRIFRDIGRLLRHRRVHTGEKPFKCNQCDYASAWPHVLKKHLKKHLNIPTSFSSFSSRNPSVNESIEENSVTSKTVKEKNPQPSLKFKIMRCKKCRRYFYKESTYISHVQNNCNTRPYKCRQCGDRFLSMRDLIIHGTVHKKEKPFKCTQCNYASKWPYLLKKHLMKYCKK